MLPTTHYFQLHEVLELEVRESKKWILLLPRSTSFISRRNRMAKFGNLNHLSIDAISKQWRMERTDLTSEAIHDSLIEWHRGNQIERITGERELFDEETAEILKYSDPVWPISSNSKLSRSDLLDFCQFVNWNPPKFWFGQSNEGPSFPGRPSVMKSVLAELEQRAVQEKLAETVAQQGRDLAIWVERTIPDEQTPKAKSIENSIRARFKVLKNPH
jgi:hypothetical protein